MKANELRIGNYINAGGNIVDVGMIKEDFVSWDIAKYKKNRVWNPFISLNDERITPIPLTEQRLLDFGFQWTDKKDSQWISVGEYELHVCRNGFSGTLDKDSSWFCSIKTGYGSQPVTLIKMYIHEIQNLYFALSGEELTLKKNMDS